MCAGSPISGAILVVAISHSVYAAEVASPEERQAALTQRMNHIEGVAQWHGEYRVTRDTYYEGPSGVVALSQRWVEAATTWAQNAHRVLGFIRAAQDQLSDPNVQAGLRERLQENQKGWFELRRLSHTIRDRGAEATARLATLGQLPEGIVPGYEKGTLFLNERRRELNASVVQTMTHFDEAEQAEWEKTLAPVAKAAAAVVRRAMLAAPELREQLAYVEQVVGADIDLYPHVSSVERAYRDFRTHLLGYRVFHAKQALDALAAVRQESVAAIGASSFDPTLQQEAVDAINRTWEAASAAWRSQEGSAKSYQLVARNLAQNERALAADCRDEEKRKQRNCALLRQFIGLKAEQLQKMTDAQLELVEDSLERVKQGPLS
jgi:hypothetical protein